MDVILGGQGAPLVGIGDKLLFSEYDMCLNIGGFANISANVNGNYVAYDICPANILLNRIAREFDMEFDEDGKIAETGKIDYDLLANLNNIGYYSEAYPKSLGREWINQNFWGIVRECKIEKQDKMKIQTLFLFDSSACIFIKFMLILFHKTKFDFKGRIFFQILKMT